MNLFGEADTPKRASALELSFPGSVFLRQEARKNMRTKRSSSEMQDEATKIHYEDVDGVRIIELCTRIDIHNVFSVEETLTKLANAKNMKVIIDFSRIEYFGSNGIRLLMLTKRKLDRLGGQLVLSNMSSFVIKILKAIDLYELFTILPDRAAAMEKLRT